MIKEVSKEIIEEDGQKFEVTKFSNGATIKASLPPSQEEIEETQEEQQNNVVQKLSAYDQMMLETSANVEYLVALAELNQ